MAQLETFSTAGLTGRPRLEHCNDVACATSVTLVESLDLPPFRGSIVQTRVGDLLMAEARSDSQIVRHTQARAARRRQSLFLLFLQLDGDSVSRQDGREARLQPNDFTLCDNGRPFELVLNGSSDMFVLGIPEALLRRHLPCPESVVAMPMSGRKGVNALLARFLSDFWRHCRDEADFGPGPSVLHAILDLIASAYSNVPRSHPDHSSLVLAHRVRIINFIESHLSDPDLTPPRIARACKMTTRYLHHLFSDEGETVARYILRRRLEECARELSAFWHRGQSVTAIAFRHGFNSPTHFGRVFRARYGVTPREYRREHAACT